MHPRLSVTKKVILFPCNEVFICIQHMCDKESDFVSDLLELSYPPCTNHFGHFSLILDMYLLVMHVCSIYIMDVKHQLRRYHPTRQFWFS